ncbi:HEPN/Toprim-associated domain-containing protein [Streptomyces sp. ATE26]|uniref:HEPN/Toprim-associated domain-containing protein n=1 Tax=Streptomyces sp. ATE26 TaxID=2954237 RepID=UPI002483105A|nr:HEPN/Toprim-associated domain-containing protein [Streptomyces sp. ATE26]MDI1454264.1 HEPN/Toprim-associated domain-containing protein [Streptomyces sp. ATE26]
MGHHSYIEIAGHTFLYCRESYLPSVAALFTEEDRCPVVEHTDDGQPWSEFVYATTVTALKERLQVQGFTQARARESLAAALAQYGGGTEPVTDPEAYEDGIRQVLAADPIALPNEKDDVSHPSEEFMEELSRWMDSRAFVRLLLDCAPDPKGMTSLDLTQLTGCCVELDPARRIAELSRNEQLADLTQNAPLLVLTEGTTDARLLSAGMDVTHPHLKGFVSFFDYAAGGAEGGVAQLARNVASFVAAGVANRFVALADNDTEGHAGMQKTLERRLPERCKVLFYPSLPLLESYPTLGPYADEPVVTDVNGRAGSLELYLGRDVLQMDNGLMPVQWKSWNAKLHRYHGALRDDDKDKAQQRFLRKVKAHRAGSPAANSDWSGIRAIIDQIVTAFD